MFKKATFKDHFSNNSKDYRLFRPTYPSHLFTYLASIACQHQTAWDCATGSGQVALPLSHYFSSVIATDASETQIQHATQKQPITYRVASAEHSGIESDSIDLITVGQAFHWFNPDDFTREVNRVLKHQGIVAIWTYNLLSIESDINSVIHDLYYRVLAGCWPKERKIVENGYKNVDFPFTELKTPSFEMRSEWDLHQLIGYLGTWSAIKTYQQRSNSNPLIEVYNGLLPLWGTAESTRPITWPLSLKVWQK